MLSLKILLSYVLQTGVVLLLAFLWFIVFILIVNSVQNWLGGVGAAVLLLVLLALVVHGCYNLVELLDDNRGDWRYERARLDFIIKEAKGARKAIDIRPGQRGCTDYIDLRSGE